MEDEDNMSHLADEFCTIIVVDLIRDKNDTTSRSGWVWKINKCFLTGHPFIVVASPKYLDYLKKLGFKTFNKWWDESYDNIIDENKRKQKIKEIIFQMNYMLHPKNISKI